MAKHRIPTVVQGKTSQLQTAQQQKFVIQNEIQQAYLLTNLQDPNTRQKYCCHLPNAMDAKKLLYMIQIWTQ